MARRPAPLALMAALALCGCRAAEMRDLNTPPALATQPSRTADELIAGINRNARRVRSLRADPDITVAVGERGRDRYGVSGRLALVRPRDFKLEMLAGVSSSKVADIGSNDEGFWFWLQDRGRGGEAKQYYVGTYGEDGTAPLLAFDPDWIVEALGLREIPPAEAKVTSVSRGTGREAGLHLLTRRSRAADGEAIAKVLVVKEQPTGEVLVLGQRLYGGDGKTLLASAQVVGNFQNVPVEPEAPGEPKGTVVLPKQVQLRWTREQLALLVTLAKPRVNVSIARNLFEEPDYTAQGYRRVDVTEQSGLASGPGVRESLPPPAAGVHLAEPVPLGPDDGARRDDPTPLVDDIPSPSPRAQLVGARPPMPREVSPLLNIEH